MNDPSIHCNSGRAEILIGPLHAGRTAWSPPRAWSADPTSQADRRILDVLDRAGVCWSGSGHVVEVSPGRNSAFEFDATHCPDLFMPLASLAVHCKGSTRIAGVARLAVKESNPGATLVGELSKLGCNLKVDKDELVIRGGQVEGGSLSARGDHRIAMAAAATGLAAQGVDTSYPDFFADLESVGTTMS